jgi:hypothetical protein
MSFPPSCPAIITTRTKWRFPPDFGNVQPIESVPGAPHLLLVSARVVPRHMQMWTRAEPMLMLYNTRTCRVVARFDACVGVPGQLISSERVFLTDRIFISLFAANTYDLCFFELPGLLLQQQQQEQQQQHQQQGARAAPPVYVMSPFRRISMCEYDFLLSPCRSKIVFLRSEGPVFYPIGATPSNGKQAATAFVGKYQAVRLGGQNSNTRCHRTDWTWDSQHVIAAATISGTLKVFAVRAPPDDKDASDKDDQATRMQSLDELEGGSFAARLSPSQKTLLTARYVENQNDDDAQGQEDEDERVCELVLFDWDVSSERRAQEGTVVRVSSWLAQRLVEPVFYFIDETTVLLKTEDPFPDSPTAPDFRIYRTTLLSLPTGRIIHSVAWPVSWGASSSSSTRGDGDHAITSSPLKHVDNIHIGPEGVCANGKFWFGVETRPRPVRSA